MPPEEPCLTADSVEETEKSGLNRRPEGLGKNENDYNKISMTD